MLTWFPLLAGGVAVAWFAARSAVRKQSANIRSSSWTRSARPRAIERLRAAIIGNDKASVAAVFGPPRASAGFSSLAPAMLFWADYVHADTWYYPLDTAAKAALVVHFDKGIAHDASLVRSPS
jgi:hypothetical protein